MKDRQHRRRRQRHWPGEPWPTSEHGSPRAAFGRWPRPARPHLVLPAVVALVQVLGSGASGRDQPPVRALDVLGYALLLIGPLALAGRRRAPAVSAAVAVAVTAGYFTLGYPRGPGFLAALVALVGAVKAGQRVASWVAGAVAYLTWALAGRLWPTVAGVALARPTLGEAVLVGTWMLVVYALAEAARVRAAHFAEAARAHSERRRAQTEQHRRQASEERLRIARELHDVLGHHLSLINVQAGVGLHLMDEHPEQARDSLVAIRQASAEALREVRAVLSALHPDEESAPRAPAAGLAGLRALVDEIAAAGLVVRIETVGAAAALPSEVDRSAYRIVQEALTNVRRHAGPGAGAVVRVEYRLRELELLVVDDGIAKESTVDIPAPEDGAVGGGIAGMRERVAALGGVFMAGPRAGGGFEVWARLPIRAEIGQP